MRHEKRTIARLSGILLGGAILAGCAGTGTGAKDTSVVDPPRHEPSPTEVHAAFDSWTATAAIELPDDVWDFADWGVSLREGVVEVRERPLDATRGEIPTFELELGPTSRVGELAGLLVPDGWIVANDVGEWGAEVWWYSTDGVQRVRIGDDPVQCFVPVGGTVLAITGHSHLTYSHGSIAQVVRDSAGHWTLAELLDLGEAAWTATASRSNGAFVATDRLIHVGVDGSFQEIAPGTDWEFDDPNSMVLTTDDCLYIGMRGHVVRVEKVSSEPRVSFLSPPAASD